MLNTCFRRVSQSTKAGTSGWVAHTRIGSALPPSYPRKLPVQGNTRSPSPSPQKLSSCRCNLPHLSASSDGKPQVQGASLRCRVRVLVSQPARGRARAEEGGCAHGAGRETPPEGSHAAVLAGLQCHLSGESPHARARSLARTHVHTASSESARQSFSLPGALKRWHLPSTAKFTRREPARALKPTPAVAPAGEWTVILRCT